MLFVDISGYTRLTEVLPHAQVNALVEQYFSSFLDCIHSHGGDINETAGDGLMVIFTDAVRPQHARRAVTAALEILRRTAQLNDQLRQTFAGLSVHIGVNSGPALVGPTKLHGSTGMRWIYTASGQVTNIAARITELAESGMILVGAETFRRIAGHFVAQELGVQQVKNVSERLMLYRILGEIET